jgi:hypothetical protein
MRLRRILAFAMSQGMVLWVLCWAAVFRGYGSLAFLWTFCLALGFAFFFIVVGALTRPSPSEPEWN